MFRCCRHSPQIRFAVGRMNLVATGNRSVFTSRVMLEKGRTIFRKGGGTPTPIKKPVEVVFQNDKRKSYGKWMFAGLVQLGIMILATSFYIQIKAMKLNLLKIETLKERLTELEAKESLTAEEKIEQFKIETKLMEDQEKMPLMAVLFTLRFLDWLFVLGCPLFGLGVLLLLKRRISKMTAKIELLTEQQTVRFWMYEGFFARKLTTLDIPYSKFTKSDVDIPKEASVFTVNVPDYHPGILIEQRGAVFGNRKKLLDILGGDGCTTNSPVDAAALVARQFKK